MEQTELIQSYMKQARRAVRRLAPTETFLAALEETLSDYVSENPDCTFDDLVDQFGTPEMAAKEFLDGSDALEPSKLAKKRTLRILIIALLCVTVVSVAAVIDSILISNQTQSKGTLELTVEEGSDMTQEIVEN